MNDRRESQRLDIGAEQQVLAVVERQSVADDAARAAAEHGRRLVQLDAAAAPRQLDRARRTRPSRRR